MADDYSQHNASKEDDDDDEEEEEEEAEDEKKVGITLGVLFDVLDGVEECLAIVKPVKSKSNRGLTRLLHANKKFVSCFFSSRGLNTNSSPSSNSSSTSSLARLFADTEDYEKFERLVTQVTALTTSGGHEKREMECPITYQTSHARFEKISYLDLSTCLSTNQYE